MAGFSATQRILRVMPPFSFDCLHDVNYEPLPYSTGGNLSLFPEAIQTWSYEYAEPRKKRMRNSMLRLVVLPEDLDPALKFKGSTNNENTTNDGNISIPSTLTTCLLYFKLLDAYLI